VFCSGLVCLYVGCTSAPALAAPEAPAPTKSVTPPSEAPEPPLLSEAPAPELPPEAPPSAAPALVERLPDLEDAVERSYKTLLGILPDTVSIAVVSIDSDNRDESARAVQKLSFLLLDSTLFNLVERRRLDQILREPRFQPSEASGELDDRSAIAIGQRTGAEVSITGTIRESESMRCLRLRVLDVETSQILAATTERFSTGSGQTLVTQANGAAP
jgi:hypothetical protein